jgi:replication factor C small subunit
MFTQKYRPKKLSEVVGNQDIIQSIKSMMPEIPHMLFKGPAGFGKTTIALCIKNELGCDFLEINASDENGVGVVRGKIKDFMSSKSLNGKFRLILLDEADATSDEFQTALRRMMEKYNDNCRIIFTCNFPHKIIEPIKSRCKGGTFEFKIIDFSEFKKGILNILNSELMTITEEALVKLYEISKGDMRIIDKLYQLSFTTKNIELKHIIEIHDDESWKELLKLIKESKYVESCRISDKKHIIPIFHELLNDNIDDDKKIKIIKVIAEWEYRSHFAQTDYIQLYALIGSLISILKTEKIQPINNIVIPKQINIFGIKK